MARPDDALPPTWRTRNQVVVRYVPTGDGSLGRIVLACAHHRDRYHLVGTHVVPEGRSQDELPEHEETYGLTCCLAGSGAIHDGNGGVLRFTGPCLLRLDEVRPHTVRWDPGVQVSECFVNLDAAMGRHLRGLGLWPSGRAVAPLDDTEPFVRAFVALVALAEDRRSDSTLVLMRCIELLVATQAHLDQAGDRRWLARASQLLADHACDGTPLAALARRMGLSDRAFRRRFHHLAGISPLEHRQRARMGEALRLLQESSVGAASAQLGFAEPAVFSRWFRRRFGHPPSRRS